MFVVKETTVAIPDGYEWQARRLSMLQIKVFGTTPPCANCKRAETQARKAAERFPGQVEVVKLDALGPEAEAYGLVVTPMVVVGERVVGTGRVVPAPKLVPIIEAELGG
jgi:thiol-disulfide isomerase/thioredoxin